MDTPSTFIGHSTFNGTSISHCNKVLLEEKLGNLFSSGLSFLSLKIITENLLMFQAQGNKNE